MSLFYTKKGDNCFSHIGKNKVAKTCVEIESLGDLDELNSLLGVIKNQKLSNRFKKILHQIQENLFIIQANIANLLFGIKHKAPEFKKSKIVEIEKIMDGFEKKLKPEKGFIIPGANIESAWLDFTRTIVRRTERNIIKMSKGKIKLSPEILIYLNRLSSLLFVMARMAVKQSGQKEKHPAYK